MKGWSLKIKVTLVYTLFMTLLTCVSLGLLFFSQQSGDSGVCAERTGRPGV